MQNSIVLLSLQVNNITVYAEHILSRTNLSVTFSKGLKYKLKTVLQDYRLNWTPMKIWCSRNSANCKLLAKRIKTDLQKKIWFNMDAKKAKISTLNMLLSIKVVNFDGSNIISNIEVSNQSCKEDHLLFKCKLNVLSLHQTR